MLINGSDQQKDILLESSSQPKRLQDSVDTESTSSLSMRTSMGDLTKPGRFQLSIQVNLSRITRIPWLSNLYIYTAVSPVHDVDGRRIPRMPDAEPTKFFIIAFFETRKKM